MKGMYLNLNFCILLIQYVAATTPTASYYHDISLSSYSGEVSYLSGHSNRGNFGDSVQAIGDFNGDGYGDFAIGAYWESSNGRYYNGNIYVFLGSTNPAMNITTNSFHNTTRFIIYGEASNYFTGISVSGAGDVNGDGLSDLIVSTELAMAQDAIRNGGTSYVIFGTKEIPAYLDLLTMTNTQGFRIWGANEFDSSGSSVAAAGDVNKDGYADVIVGAYNATNVGYANTGAAYVIYGKASGFVNIDLLLMTSSQGFRIYGAVAGEAAGYSVSGADVNGDGYSDLIIGAYYSDSFTGKVYVLFGKAGNRPTFQLQDMVLGTDGFIIEAAESGDGLGVAVAGLMDVNGDKIPDLVVGSHWATWDYRAHCGVAYILFGKSSFAGTIDLGNITSRDGFSVIGAVINYNTGSAVSSAGDVNGDGVGDIIIGSNQATVNGNTNAGITHIIFGSRLTADIDLLRFPSTRGFYIEGAHTGDYSGTSVGGGADFNGDGLGDIIIGATGAAGSITDAGMAYIVYGMLNPPPTGEPTSQPSRQPTTQPTKRPTRHPTSQPTRRPSSQPTSQPTRQPTGQPTAKPTRAPTGQPTRRPSRKPTGQPSSQPRGQPSRRPASRPSSRPSGQPSRRPSGQPSKRPSSQPTIFPSHRPTKAPSPQPSSRPSKQPNSFPTSVPSPAPTPSPTFAPTLPIATSEVYIRLVNVSTNIFSTEAQDALIETMNRILTNGISVSYESIPDSVQYGTHRWDVVVNLHLIEPLNNFKNIYGTNETKFTTAIKEELLTSVNSGQFSSILKEQAQIYNATEIASTSAATMIEFNSYTNLIESSSNDDNSDFNIFSFSEELSIIIICLGGVIVILLFSVILFCAWQSYLVNMIQRLSGVRKTVFIENVTIQTWNNDVDDFQDNIFSYTEEQEKNLQKSPFRQIRRDLEAADKHTELQFPN